MQSDKRKSPSRAVCQTVLVVVRIRNLGVDESLRTVQRLRASAYTRRMTSGRTKPAVFMCEDLDGNSAGEFVVKLKRGIETGVVGLVCELLSALLAAELGLRTPNPAIVEIDPAIGGLLGVSDSEMARIIRNSGGLNFASEVLVGGYGVWPIDKSVPASLRSSAGDMLTFDALIQNPDRKVNNPNFLWKANEIFLIDHELAFSFLYEIGERDNPWSLRGKAGNFLNEHVFYRELKGRELDLARFQGALEAISDDDLAGMFDQIPREWNNDRVSRISNHVKSVRDHAAEFINQVKWRLA